MKWKHYLFDQPFLLLTFFVSMAITSIIILLDPNINIHISNLFYLLLILALLFFLFLLVDYLRKKGFYQELKEKTEVGGTLDFDTIHRYDEKFTIQLLKNQKEQYEQQLLRLKNEQKEWYEYMTSWVHEIKTPISVSHMIYETEQSLDSLEEEMGKIEHLVDQALYYTRTSHFSKDYFIQEMNVEQLIKEAIKGNHKLFLSKKIKLQLDLTELEVLTDKKALLFIMNQFLSNALKYTPVGGEISIRIQENERKIIIRDNGMGIPAEDLPRIFEKGFTGKNGRHIAASTGLGLYLAKKTADKIGHQLSLYSKEGSHTEAIVQFSKNVDFLRDEFNHFSEERT
ncbi:sensor histidine kinase [Pseudoneobacillus sp. C159]